MAATGSNIVEGTHPDTMMETSTEHQDSPLTPPSDASVVSSHQQQQQQRQPIAGSQEASAEPGMESETPEAFPAKRRGRPPGRPNMTVKETDFEDDPLVQKWNNAKAERGIAVVAVSIREALTEAQLVYNTQREVFAMPSRQIIYFVQNWITARHIASKRPSYVNGLLIHSRGNDAPTECDQCAERRSKHALGPFPSCRTLPGKFGDSCSNCKWFDNTSSCSLFKGPKPNRKRKSKASKDDDRSPEAGAAEEPQDKRSRNDGDDGSEQPRENNAIIQPEHLAPPNPTVAVTTTTAKPATTTTPDHHLLHPDLLEPGNQSTEHSDPHQIESPIAGVADEADARLVAAIQSAIQ